MTVGTNEVRNIYYVFILDDPTSWSIVRFVSEQFHIGLSISEDLIFAFIVAGTRDYSTRATGGQHNLRWQPIKTQLLHSRMI